MWPRTRWEGLLASQKANFVTQSLDLTVAISRMCGEIASLLISSMAVPMLSFMVSKPPGGARPVFT